MDVERGVEEANEVPPHAEDALDLEEGELREEDSPRSSSSSSTLSKDAEEMEVEAETTLPSKAAASADEDGTTSFSEKRVRAKRRSDNGEHEHAKKRSKDKKASKEEDNGGRHKRHRSDGVEGGGDRDEEGTTSYRQHGDGAADGEGDRRKKRKEERSSANHHHDHRDDHHSRHREHHKDRSGSDKRERSSSSSRDKRASEERHSSGRSERERSRHTSRERERERDGRGRDGGDRGRSSSREDRSRDGSQKRRLDEPHRERYDRDDQGRDRRGYDRPDERDHRGTGDRRYERDYERGRERYRDEYRGRDDERRGYERSGEDDRRRRDDELTSDARKQEQEKKTKQAEDADYAKMVEEELRRKETEQTEEEKAQKLIEERRKRRQAILDKYKQDKTATATAPAATTVSEAPAATAPAAPAAVAETSVAAPEVQPEKKDEEAKAETGADLQPQPEEPKKVTHFDMFNELPSALIPSDQTSRRPLGAAAAAGEDELNLADNWDDEEGYYAFRIGEIINKRYTVHASHGKGVFSTVLIAKDAQNDNIDVAIKVIRNNDTMFRAGLKEKELLEKITNADPKDKRHCIRIFDSFQYRNHLCLVLEPMSMNLREAVKKFGRDVGITMRAVRTYARQLFLSLKHLKSLNMLHADLKPDNIVLNAKLNVLKLCDFGSASLMEEENAITPYLVSRFYRAPEIMLGLPYDFGIDMWAAGCCLYEMYTGKILYPGKSNNEMLRMQMDSMGPFPRKMLRKSKFWQRHFNVQNFHFLQICIDEVSQQEYVKEVNVMKPVRDLKAELQKAAGVEDEAVGDALQLADLMLKCLNLDPAKRLSAEQALAHPFLKA